MPKPTDSSSLKQRSAEGQRLIEITRIVQQRTDRLFDMAMLCRRFMPNPARNGRGGLRAFVA
jgi:hypothetical protein